MSNFLEEITRENINKGDFIIRKGNHNQDSYLAVINEVHNADGIVSIIKNNGIDVYTINSFMEMFKRVKRENIESIENDNFYIKEPILREDFFDYRRHGKRMGYSKDFMVSLILFPLWDVNAFNGNMVMLDSHKVGDKINELEKDNIKFTINVIYKISFIPRGSIKILKSKIDKVVIKTK